MRCWLQVQDESVLSLLALSGNGTPECTGPEYGRAIKVQVISQTLSFWRRGRGALLVPGKLLI